MSETCRLGPRAFPWGGLALARGSGATPSIGNTVASYGRDDVEAAFAAARDAGCTLFDTAEIYGRGESERILGPLARASRGTVVATKYWPSPRRWRSRSVNQAIDRSLRRLDVDVIDLYQIHMADGTDSAEATSQGAVACRARPSRPRGWGEQLSPPGPCGGCTPAWRISACRWRRTRSSTACCGARPRTMGCSDACRDLDVTLLAYSPLAQGMLTGKLPLQQSAGRRPALVAAISGQRPSSCVANRRYADCRGRTS